MFKKISGLCASAACLLGLCTTAFADGPVGRAIGGVVDAGEDIADGIFNAGEDIVDGVTGSAGDDENGDVPDLTTPEDGTTSGDNTTSDPDTTTSDTDTTTSDTNSTTSGDNAIGDTSDGLISGVEESGATGGNPGTGDVTMGYAAFSAVLAAMGVTLSSIRRKQD